MRTLWVSIAAALSLFLLPGCDNDPQAPPEAVEFMKEIDDIRGSVELFHATIKSDNGYALVGEYISDDPSIPVETKILLLQADATGTLISKAALKIDGYRNQVGLSVTELSTGKLLIAARAMSMDLQKQLLILFELGADTKITPIVTLETYGQAEWSRVIPDGDGFYLAYQTAKGINQSLTEFRTYMSRFENSVAVWQVDVGRMLARDLDRAANGDFLIAGSMLLDNNINNLDMSCARITENGSVYWHVLLGDPTTFDVGQDICENNGRVLALASLSYDNKPALFVLHEDALLSAKVDLDPAMFSVQSMIRSLGDGALVITRNGKGTAQTINLMKLNANFQVDWSEPLADGLDTEGNLWIIDVLPHPDGGTAIFLMAENKVRLYKLKKL